MYYCENCKELFEGIDIICGEIYSEDEYDNMACPECGDENIIELDENRFCPICELYHEYSDEYASCAKEIYTDVWALRFISDNISEAVEYMLNNNMTLREYILAEPEDFVRFVDEMERNERQENINLYKRAGLIIPKYLLNA